MNGPASASEVLQRLITGIGEGRWHDLADLYAEDVVVDQPLAAPQPLRITGREQVRARFAGAAGRTLRFRPHNVVVHETSDPEVVVAEFDCDVHDTATGRRITAANVQVLRVRDGLIVASRDYHDTLRIAATSGRAADLAAAVEREAAAVDLAAAVERGAAG